MLDALETVKRDLLKLPNVVAVGLGLKETNGEFTDEISYRVYVAEKRDRASLKDSEAVPDSIGDFKTDVLPPLVVKDDSDVCGNERRTLAKHRPLQGGIAISTDAVSYGTLGWFGTLDADDSKVLLTNKHVLYDETNEIVTDARKTAQPQLGDPSECCCCECGSDNVVGESLIGIRDLSPMTATSVDAAIARIDEAHASNILLSITNDSTEEVLEVTGTATAVVGQTVRKIGARSGFTRGTVIHVGDMAAAPADPGGGTIAVRTGQVLVIPVADETYEVREGVCKRAFSNSGDSGAVILNDAGEIIALNWGGNRTTYTIALTVASNIANVLTALADNGFPLTLSTSPGGGDRAVARSDAVAAAHLPRPAPDGSPANLFERLRDANRHSLLAWLFERHHREILQLVNHKRPVTVVWHRAQGPAYVAALSRAGRVEQYRVPLQIAGVDRRGLLRAMERVLLEHGSEALRKDIERYRDELMSFADPWDTLEALAAGLQSRGFIDVVPSMVRPARTGT